MVFEKIEKFFFVFEMCSERFYLKICCSKKGEEQNKNKCKKKIGFKMVQNELRRAFECVAGYRRGFMTHTLASTGPNGYRDECNSENT